MGVIDTARVPSTRRIQPLSKESVHSAAPTAPARCGRLSLQVETRATKHAPSPVVPCCRSIDVDAELAQQLHAGIGHQAAVLGQLDLAVGDKRVGERHAETTGEVVVAGPGRPQRRIAGPDRELGLRGLRA